MNRILLAAGAAILGITAAAAQTVAPQDAVAQRRAIMKGVGEQTKIAAGMVKGEIPYDPAKAETVLATYIGASERMPGLYPPESKTGGDTAASPRIWEELEKHKALFAKLGDEAKAGQASTKDLASFRPVFANLSKNCGNCHDTYRVKK